jgi:hypothetical protein
LKRHVRAISIGSAALKTLKEKTAAKVHSVFERTFNILVGEKMVGISRSDVSRNPINLIIDIPTDETMKVLGVKKNMPVAIEENLLITGNVLEISLENTPIWKPRIQIENPLTSDLVWQNLESTKRIAMQVNTDDGLAPLLKNVDSISKGELQKIGGLNEISKKALPFISDLIEGVEKNIIEEVEHAIGKLVGLGPGLTPCADDFLSGFASSLGWVSRSLEKHIDYVNRINEEIAAQAGKTNLLSRQLLEHATKGEINERAEKLLIAILRGPGSELEPLVREVMEIGETSGIDMMVGILLGVEIGLKMNESLKNRTFPRTLSTLS